MHPVDIMAHCMDMARRQHGDVQDMQFAHSLAADAAMRSSIQRRAGKHVDAASFDRESRKTVDMFIKFAEDDSKRSR